MAAKSTEPLKYSVLPKKLGSPIKERHKLLGFATAVKLLLFFAA